MDLANQIDQQLKANLKLDSLGKVGCRSFSEKKRKKKESKKALG